MSQIVTGDAVVLDLRPARVPTRLLATAVDLLLIGGALYGWSYATSQISGSTALITALEIVGSILVMLAYPITMETLNRGRTVGAMAMGLRVVRDDGGTIRFRQAVLRWLAYWAIDFAIWTGFCAGLIAASVNPQSKRLGDLIAGTMVIRTRAPRRPKPVPEVSDALAVWAAQLELSRLSDELVTASRHLVQRQAGLLDFPRRQLATDLALQVAARTAPAPPVRLEPLDFLAAVVAERRRRQRR